MTIQKNLFLLYRSTLFYVVITVLLISGFANSENGNAELHKARALLELGKFRKTYSILKNAEKKDLISEAQIDTALFLMGHSQEKRGKISQAAFYYKRAYEVGFKPQTNQQTDIWKKAVNELNTLYDAYSNYNNEKYITAKDTLITLLDKDLYKQDRLEPLFALGRVYVQLEDLDKAMDAFTAVLNINKHYEPLDALENEMAIYEAAKVKHRKLWSRIKRNKWYIAGGVVVTGVIVYCIINCDGEDDLPAAPNFPSREN